MQQQPDKDDRFTKPVTGRICLVADQISVEHGTDKTFKPELMQAAKGATGAETVEALLFLRRLGVLEEIRPI